jgi:hypothetical protein
MGNSTPTRTRTRVKPVPALTGMGTAIFGYGFSRVLTGMVTRVGYTSGYRDSLVIMVGRVTRGVEEDETTPTSLNDSLVV